jgi:predicted GNAT superfamily acetyltransferase
MYGADTGSVLHSGLGTDRFIMQWNLRDPVVDIALRGDLEPVESAAVEHPVNTRIIDDAPQPIEGDLPGDREICIEIPGDIHQVKTDAPQIAAAWRNSTRRAFKWYMENRYNVIDFKLHKEAEHGFYTLRENQK